MGVRKKSNFFESAILPAAATFGVYVFSVFYLKGYLRVFGADSSWFKPDTFQLVSFSSKNLSLTAGLLVSGAGILGFSRILAKTIVDARPRSSRKIGYFSGQYVYYVKIKFPWYPIIGAFVSLIIFSIFWHCIFGSHLDDVVAGRFSEFRISVEVRTALFLFPILAVGVPVILLAGSYVWFHFRYSLQERIRKNLRFVEKCQRRQPVAMAHSRVMKKLSLILSKSHSRKTLFGLRSSALHMLMTKLFLLLVTTAFFAAMAFFSGLAQAGRDINEMNYAGLEIKYPHTKVSMVFGDGHNVIIMKNRNLENTIVFMSPELDKPVVLARAPLTERAETDLKIRYAIRRIVEEWKLTGRAPLMSGLHERKGKYVKFGGYDAWDMPLSYRVEEDTFSVISSGPDRLFDTDDDMGYSRPFDDPIWDSLLSDELD